MFLKASIDIGTNSTRLLVVDCSPDNILTSVEHYEHVTKLGAGLDAQKNLSSDAMQRVIDALSHYRRIIATHKISDIRLFATSATRDARNRGDFISLIKQQTGFNCRLLSGDEEARLSFLGVVSDLKVAGPFLVCDVGGGSSEFIFADGRKIIFCKSLNIGSGRLHRDFLRHDPPTKKEVHQAMQFIALQLQRVQAKPERIIAVGGTAVALALIDAETPFDKPDAAHHYQLPNDRLHMLTNKLMQQTIENRKSLVGLNPQRADVILGGALIYSEILKFFGVRSMMTSLRDLMFGIFLE